MIKFLEENKVKILSIFLCFLVVFSVTSSLYALTDVSSNTIKFTYETFDFTIDISANTLTAYNNTSKLSKVYNLGDLLTKNYIYFSASPYNGYPSTYSEFFNFALTSADEFKWAESPSGTFSYLSANTGYFLAFDYTTSLSSGSSQYSYPWSSSVSTFDTKDFLQNRGAYGLRIYSGETSFYYNASVPYSNFDIMNPYTDEVISGNKVKKIVYDITPAVDNKSATFSAHIQNGEEGDKLYYSTMGVDIYGKLLNPIEVNQSISNIVSLDRNEHIFFQAIDSQGNIIDTVSTVINTLDDFNMEDLVITLKNSTSLKPVKLFLNYQTGSSIFYEIEYSISLLSTTGNNSDISLSYAKNSGNYEQVSFDTLYTWDYGSYLSIFQNNVSLVNIQSIYELSVNVKNKSTGESVGIKKFNFTIITSPAGNSSAEINSSTFYDDESDYDSGNGFEDDNYIVDSGYSDYFPNSNYKDIMEMLKGNGNVFAVINYILSLFPSWITLPIFFFLSSLAVIAVIKKILS